MAPGNVTARGPAAGSAGVAAGRSMPPARFSAQARLKALQADIMELILERGLEAGDALPTENELSAELGVGRNTLRESLKVLQALGVIEIRHGFGMFVAPAILTLWRTVSPSGAGCRCGITGRRPCSSWRRGRRWSPG